MLVHVLHHGHCFDGVASAAIFSAFFRQCIDSDAEFVFIPKLHAPGDPFQPSDFQADVVACVDFRYSDHPDLHWWFDHHQSAFQLPGQRQHFESDTSHQKFFDPHAPCCATLIAEITAQRFGFDSSGYHELLHWAKVIDSVAFPRVEIPVQLSEPALWLMTFAEHNKNPNTLPSLIHDLLARPLAETANAPYIRAVVDPVLQQHRVDIELMRIRCHIRDEVVEYDLLDQPPRAYNKFIAYYHYPQARYVVGTYTGPDGHSRLTVGYNPWLRANERDHNLAQICEGYGGGGHPFASGVSFGADSVQQAREAQRAIATMLRTK